ncbi:MAG: tyrosine-protein phosphatase [Treponema sp.]|nr:tyrosine-protein phosphatase [Treponema sp.]
MEFDHRQAGYRFIEKDLIEFWCQADMYKDIEPDESVYVCGSFNGWLNTGDSAWKLSKKQDNDCLYYSIQKPLSLVMIPGNTGFPEFRFFGLSNERSHLLNEKKKFKDFSFHDNKLIIRNEEDLKLLTSIKKNIVYKKNLSDFDENCPACRADISNVRIVPGTKCLFRGYNIFKKSKADMDTEELRLNLVQKAYELYGIRSDITLNGYEGANVLEGESIPEIIKSIEKEGNRLCISIDYNLVYFHSDAWDYISTIQKVARFILEHPSPYFLHSRLGSDRTGVTCAIFASLCGSSWEEIAEDFEKTSNMGICEYRNRRLLQYSVEKLIGKNPAECKNLSDSVKNLFIKEKILSSGEIHALIKKLNEPLKRKETDFFDFTGNHICKFKK